VGVKYASHFRPGHVHSAGKRKAAAVDLAFRGLDLIALGVNLHQRRRSNLFEQETVGVDQEMVVPAWHARRDACVDQIRPSEQIDKAVAGGKVEARLPFRLGHLCKENFCCRHGRFLHRKSPAIERILPASVSSQAFPMLISYSSRIREYGLVKRCLQRPYRGNTDRREGDRAPRRLGQQRLNRLH